MTATATITPTTETPVAVIGAGPIGLAAAANLAARRLPFVVIEAGESVGDAIADWAHVRLFSPWRYCIDPASQALLDGAGWTAPSPDHLPTGGELINEYLVPLAAHPALAQHIKLGVAVTAVARQGIGKITTAGREEAPFTLRLSDGSELVASAVIDASGTWRTPNPLGASGLPAHGEQQVRDAGRVLDGMPDVLGRQRDHFAGKRVAVVGAGHSATGTLIALAHLANQEPATSAVWLVRSGTAARAFGDGDDDALPARGELGRRAFELVRDGAIELHTGFAVHEVTARAIVAADGTKVEADVIVNATGARPDFSFASELRLDLDPVLGSTPALAPLIDPNEHSCGTVRPHGVDELTHPEQGYYAIGAKSYGRAPTFLLATGYEQARSVVAALDGDWVAARDVKLTLPATGACSSTLPIADGASSCC